MDALTESILHEMASDQESPPEHKAPSIAQLLSLPLSRTLSVDRRENTLEIWSNEGAVELKVRLTEEGPVLVFDHAKVALKTSGDLELESRNMSLRARGRLTMESDEDCKHRVGGSYSVSVRDDAHLRAQAIDISAELGELSMKASDDIALNGLRVLLNVLSQEELDKKARRATTLRELLELPFNSPGGPQRFPKTPPKEREDW